MAIDWVILGLGNPGAEYAHTRHNAGADAVMLLSARRGGSLRRDSKIKVVADTISVGSQRVLVAFPQTYYNESGVAAAGLLRRHDLEADRLLVIHDELDLPPGRIKIKFGGGLAGNKGLASVKAHLGTEAFSRIRLGVGKPPGTQRGADHVLRQPGKAERVELDITIQEAADATELLVSQGIDAAMLRYNGKGSNDPEGNGA